MNSSRERCVLSSKSLQLVTGFLMFLAVLAGAIQGFAQPAPVSIGNDSWFSMNPSTNGAVYAIASDKAGNIYIGGEFTEVAGIQANNIAKWDPVMSTWSPLIQELRTLTLDGTSSANGVNGAVRAIAIYGTYVYVGGSFTTAGMETANCIAIWNSEFSSWSSLNSGMDGAFDVVNALAIDTNTGSLYVGGLFPTAGYFIPVGFGNMDLDPEKLLVNNIAKVDVSGTWSALGSEMGTVGVNEEVNALAFDSVNSVIYAGGWFTAAGDLQSVNYIAKWDINTSSWNSLMAEGGTVAGTSGSVNALALDGSGSLLYVGGLFATAGELPANNIAIWNGFSWSALGSGTNGSVNALSIEGKRSALILGGSFTTAGDVSASNIARYEGSFASLRTEEIINPWSALGSGTDNTVRVLVFSDYGTLYAGGNFTIAGGKYSNYLAKCATVGNTVPGAPTGVAVESYGDSNATVSFNAPENDGGSSILSYTLTSSPGGITVTEPATVGLLPGYSIKVFGLTNGTAYTFKVTATNSLGKGPASASTSPAVTPSTVPDAPVIGTAVRGNGSVTVNFTAPKSNGGSPITSYTVNSVTPAGISVIRSGSSAAPITITGLTYNVPYIFTVTAANQWGNSMPSDPTGAVTPSGAAPGIPDGVNVMRGGSGELIVYFNTPPANGSEITGYTVIAYSGNISVPGNPSGTLIRGLTNGTKYCFKVTATNALGTSPASLWSPWMIPAVAPGAPTGIVATPGILQATIAFNAPLSNGGMPVTGYTLISVTPSGITATSATSPITLTGLRNIEYTFNLTANNVVGPSVPVSVSVTPKATVPGAPTGVNAIRGNAQATVNFTPPRSNGGSPITMYTVTSYPGYKTVTASGISASPIKVLGLTNGTAYTFTVKATNVIGTGPSASLWSPYVTPATVPFAPKIGTAVGGAGQVTVNFTAPAAVEGVPGNGGSPITFYTVTTSPAGISAVSKASGPIIVTGLTGGQRYDFTVTATNVIGESASSNPSSATPTVSKPGSPTGVTASPGDGQATVSFTAPLANGSEISEYIVTSNPGSITASGITASPITVTGLTNGTSYSFNVKAKNTAGTGPVSAWSSPVTPSTVPFAPINVKAVRGNGQATVSFTAPAALRGVPGNGGSPITMYTVTTTTTPGGVFVSTVTRASSPITVSGLINGQAYVFAVTATNKNGAGDSNQAEATPATVPGVPTITGVSSGNKSVRVSFDAPSIDGGSPIQSYTVTSTPGGKTAIVPSSGYADVTGLTNGTTYTFKVTAKNDVGTGVASEASNPVKPGVE